MQKLGVLDGVTFAENERRSKVHLFEKPLLDILTGKRGAK